ncbi:hypothetical protein [Mucisphaera sp.]|uniref:hypothetical protein n=1 Tax=Mucisphaera sp. TaxID=2913024 RepID=UPI003D0F394A
MHQTDLTRLLWTAGFAATLTTGTAAQALVLNEVRHDDPGADTEEYVELLGAPGQSLEGLTFVVIGDDASDSKSGVIESVVSLDGLSLGANGLFLLTSDVLGQETGFDPYIASGPTDLTTDDLVLENGDNVTYLLVSGFTGALGDDLDAVDELSEPTLDVKPWASIIDVVSLFDGDNLGDFGSSEINYGPGEGFITLGPTGTFPPAHIYRLAGGGAWQIGEFAGAVLDTPGAQNVPTPATAALLALGAAKLLGRRSSTR